MTPERAEGGDATPRPTVSSSTGSQTDHHKRSDHLPAAGDVSADPWAAHSLRRARGSVTPDVIPLDGALLGLALCELTGGPLLARGVLESALLEVEKLILLRSHVGGDAA